MVVIDATIVNVALPDMQRDLHFSPAALSWVLNAYTLTFGGLLLLGARLGDILGRRATFVSGVVLFTVASAVGGLADDAAVLLIARAAQGVGAAFAAPAALALLMALYPEGRERMRALGLFTAVSVGGFSLGLVLGGALTETLGWRAVLYVNVPLGILVAAAAALVLPATARESRHFDLAGAVTSTAGVGLLVYGLVKAAEAGWSSTVALGAIAGGVALLAVFVIVERRAAEPITPMRLFASVTRSSALAGRLLMVAGNLGMMFFLTQFMQDVMHLSPLVTGLCYLPMTGAVFLATQLSARYFTRLIPPRKLLVAGFALQGLSLLWVSQLSVGTTYVDLVIPFVLFGFGGGSTFLSLTNSALDGVHPDDAGAASGVVNAMQQLGGTLGLAVLVAVFGAVSSGISTPAGYTDAVSETFVVAALLLLANAVLMFVTQPRVVPAR